jgi:microcystin-dependent protein
MAGEASASDWTLANGSLLPINANTALFSLLGTIYGGNGTTNFALPNLAGAQPKGAGPAGVNYYICTAGVFP